MPIPITNIRVQSNASGNRVLIAQTGHYYQTESRIVAFRCQLLNGEIDNRDKFDLLYCDPANNNANLLRQELRCKTVGDCYIFR